jgi:protein SCO1/2
MNANWQRMILAGVLLAIGTATVAAEIPRELQGIRFDQRLNAQLPLDLAFTDDTGRRVQLKEYFQDKPVILVLAYYQCPRLCTLVLNGLVQGLLEIPYSAGRDFQVVIVSFDPDEDWELAAAKKRAYLRRYGKPESENGWHFLTGEEANIRQLADTVGFTYRYDERKRQYMHASGIMVATPEGKLSRYLYDVRYSGRDLRLALTEASAGKVGSPVEQVLLFCFHYDPTLGRYSANVMILVRFLGVATLLGIGYYVWRLSRSQPGRFASIQLQRPPGSDSAADLVKAGAAP